MATARNEFKKLAEEAARVLGNDSVEKNPGGRDWLYRITFPDGFRVQLHGSPSEPNYMENTLKDMDKHGWSKLKRERADAERERKLANIQADAERNALKFDEAARKSRNFTPDPALSRFVGPYAPQPVDVNWLFTKHTLPDTRRVLITPDIAAKILNELNTANRPIRKGRVAFWASIIKRGRWRFTHQGIAFDVNAALQDGQQDRKSTRLNSSHVEISYAGF